MVGTSVTGTEVAALRRACPRKRVAFSLFQVKLLYLFFVDELSGGLLLSMLFGWLTLEMGLDE